MPLLSVNIRRALIGAIVIFNFPLKEHSGGLPYSEGYENAIEAKL